MAIIVPAILPKTLKEWQEKIRRIQGLVSRAQVDIIDNQFADNKTIDLNKIKPWVEINLDVQLMVKEPIFWVGKCRKIGASLVIGQIEMMPNQLEFIEMVKQSRMRTGLGLDLETALERLDREVIGKIDHVLLMSVKTGFSGQKFNLKVLEKIKKLRNLAGKNLEIGVDGGICEHNIRQLIEAGADVLYIGSALWRVKDIHQTLEKLKDMAN